MPGIDIDIQYAIDDNVTTVPSVVCLPPCLWYVQSVSRYHTFYLLSGRSSMRWKILTPFSNYDFPRNNLNLQSDMSFKILTAEEFEQQEEEVLCNK